MKKWTALTTTLSVFVFLAVFSWLGSGFSAPNGKEVLESRCGDCHGLDRVTSKTKDRAGWQSTVNRMISKGANLNADEKAALIDYLVNK